MKAISYFVIAGVLCAMPLQRASAHAGDLDATFGTGGVVVVANLLPASPFDQGDKVAIQPDGKILVVGRAGGDASGIWRSAFAVTRLNPDGGLDTSFGPYHDGHFIFAWAAGPASATAIAFDTDGDIVIGGNVANLAGVVWLTPDGIIDSNRGENGTMTFATNGDTANQTTLTGLIVQDERSAVNSTYGIAFTGNYNGSGHEQFMVGWYSYDQTSAPALLVSAFDAQGSSGVQSIATSVVDEASYGGIAVGGYADFATSDGHHTNCVVANFGIIGLFDSNDNLYFVWEQGISWANRFFTAGSAEEECYVDALAPNADGDYVIAAGREILDSDGSWRAMYFELNSNRGTGYSLLPYYKVFQLTSWGDNSIRAVLPEDGGKWAFAGFSGVDSSGIPDPVAARINFLDGSNDSTFGTNGISIVDFDPNDYAYGQTAGAALDAHGCMVMVGTYWNGNSDANGNDLTQIYIARLLGDGGDSSDTIFANGFEIPAPVCGP